LKIAFLDRDGVINEDFGYVSKIDRFVFRQGIFDFCNFLNEIGYDIAVVTNQSGLAKKFFTQSDYRRLTSFMVNEFSIRGIDIIDVSFCPHRDSDKCGCRKPMPGMINKILKKHKVLSRDCILVGDKLSDLQAAEAAKIGTQFLMSSSLRRPNGQSSVEDFDAIKAKLKDRATK